MKSLLLQATRATTPVRSAPTIENNGSKSTLVIEMDTRDLNLTTQDKEALAANLAIGASAEAPLFVGDTRTDIWFSIPNARIIWWVSHNDQPGIIQVAYLDGPVGGMNTKEISKEHYELTDEANTFARNWLASKPQ